MVRILASVGRGGINIKNDVEIVQRLLNAHLFVPLRPLVVDGLCGVQTIAAIKYYQTRALGVANPDGRVDPGGPTLVALDKNCPGGGAFKPVTKSQVPSSGGNSKPQSPPSAPPSLNTGVPTRQAAFQFFVDRGWTREQAAGIVANLIAESNLNTAAVGDSGQAAGIAQWHADRQKNFFAAIGVRVKEATLEQQLTFVHYELTQGTETGAGNKLRKTTSAKDAGATVSKYYERPLKKDEEAKARGDAAVDLLRNMGM